MKDLWIYHLNKKVYGGLIAVDWDDTDDPIYSATAHVETKRKATECDLETDSDHMMIVKQSGTNLNRLSFVLSILTGLIWIIWLILPWLHSNCSYIFHFFEYFFINSRKF